MWSKKAQNNNETETPEKSGQDKTDCVRAGAKQQKKTKKGSPDEVDIFLATHLYYTKTQYFTMFIGCLMKNLDENGKNE